MHHLSDALRKHHSCSVMSTNVEQNITRLKEQALKKSIYRQRKKMKKASLELSVRESSQMTSDFEETGSTFQSSSNPEKTEPYPSPSTSFRHKATKTRSLKKAKNFLPRSPSKRKEVIKELASNFLRIKFTRRNKPWHKLKELEEHHQEWLIAFSDRADIPRQTPGRKDNVFVEKENDQRKYLQKWYLLWNIRDLLEIANGRGDIDDDSFQSKFNKKITFRQLYNFLKEHKEYKFNKNIPHESCACEVCENVRLLILSINRKLKDPTKKLSLDINDIVEIDKLHITDTDFESNSSSSSSSDSEDSLNPTSDLQLSY